MSLATLDTAFNIVDLFEQVHGYRPAYVAGLPDNPPALPPAQVQPATKKTVNLYGETLYGQADMIGREVFCPITIEVDGTDYNFPFAVIGIDRTKTVVETQMTELNGSVKEIIGNNDFEISIKGFVIGDYDQFPDDKIKMLNDVFEWNQTVRLKSAFSDIFLHSNDYVLIKKLSIPEKPKVIGVRDFAFSAVSDGIFNLYIS
jgi:hypothetical protein